MLVVNNPNCEARRRAQRLGVPCVIHDHREFSSREELDKALVKTFTNHAVEGVVMAGWMRIVTPILIAAFPNRLINIHPSLLPSFRGLDAVGQALKARVLISGCSVHLVTPQVDDGPVLAKGSSAWSINCFHYLLLLQARIGETKLKIKGRRLVKTSLWLVAIQPSGLDIEPLDQLVL